MTDCPDANLLARLADGAASNDERAQLEAHLDTCAPCSATMSELGGLASDEPGVLPPGYRVLAPDGEDRWSAETLDGRCVTVTRVGRGTTDRARILRDAVTLVEILHAHAHGDEVMLVTAPPPKTTLRAATSPPRSADQVLALWTQAIARVAELHRRGIVHDGLSPDTIRLGDIVELGVLGERVDEPAYRAPELRHDRPPTPASDQFALCVGLWEALARRRPYSGVTPGALAVSMQAPLVLPPGPERPLFAVLARGLALEPARRWPDLEALRVALDSPPALRPRWVLPAAIAVVTAVGIGLALALV